MAFDRYRDAAEESVELNVVPVMNLFMVLIPFLLLGATFFHIGVIPTTTPTLSPSESDIPKTPKTVVVTLKIEKEEFEISIQSISLSEEEMAELGQVWPKKGGKYQVDALQKALVAIKTTYPESNTITVMPYEELPYQDLITIVDMTRNRAFGKDKNGDTKYQDIFPVTIFSRLIKEAPPVEGEAAEGEAAEGEAEEEEEP